MLRLTPLACRTGALAIILSIAMLTSTPVRASDLTELDQLAGPDLETTLKQALAGNPPAGVTVEELRGGFVKVNIPSQFGNPALAKAQAKNLLSCAIYIGLVEPAFETAGILRFDAAPIAEFPYRAGWLVYNSSSDPITAMSSIKTKGPGPDLKFEGEVTYFPNSFSVAFGTFESGWKEGVHSVTVKIKGAKPGKLKGTFCTGCDF